MGYFSNMATEMWISNDDDHSYPSPERQLLWRLDDLKDRLEDLINAGASQRNGYIFTDDDLRYALSKHLGDICKVERAIELAQDDLLNKYGINVYDVVEEGSTLGAAIGASDPTDCPERMTLIEMLVPTALTQTKIAA